MQNKDQFSAFDVSVSQGDHDRQPSLEVETTTTAVVTHLIDATGTKKRLAHTIRLLSFFRVMSLLAQAIVAILMHEKQQVYVFATMYGFSILSGIIDVIGIFNYYISVIGVICIQTSLSVLFMWTCGWTFQPMIILCVFGFLQLGTVLVEASYAYIYDDDEGYPALSPAEICQACYSPIAIGGLTLPYIFYNANSVFRQDWFDVIIMISLWLTGIQQEKNRKLLRDYTKEEIEDTLSVNLFTRCDRGVPWYIRVILFVNQTWAFGLTILIYILNVQYAKDQSWVNDYEKGFTIFTIVCQSCFFCCFCTTILMACVGTRVHHVQNQQGEKIR